jgi:DNA-binding response OmpR family regulator
MAAPSILLVDDEPMLRGATASMLTRRGGRVSVARDIDEAVELASEELYDVVVLDLSGAPPTEDTARLRARLSASCRVIFCIEPDRSRGFDGVDVLKKPFDFEHLLDLVFGPPARRKRSCSGVFPLFDALAHQGRTGRGKPS